MGSPTDLPLDIPDGDAAEQARDLRPPEQVTAAPTEAPGTGEVDEYDAVEQAIIVEEDEDDYR